MVTALKVMGQFQSFLEAQPHPDVKKWMNAQDDRSYSNYKFLLDAGSKMSLGSPRNMLQPLEDASVMTGANVHRIKRLEFNTPYSTIPYNQVNAWRYPAIDYDVEPGLMDFSQRGEQTPPQMGQQRPQNVQQQPAGNVRQQGPGKFQPVRFGNVQPPQNIQPPRNAQPRYAPHPAKPGEQSFSGYMTELKNKISDKRLSADDRKQMFAEIMMIQFHSDPKNENQPPYMPPTFAVDREEVKRQARKLTQLPAFHKVCKGKDGRDLLALSYAPDIFQQQLQRKQKELDQKPPTYDSFIADRKNLLQDPDRSKHDQSQTLMELMEAERDLEGGKAQPEDEIDTNKIGNIARSKKMALIGEFQKMEPEDFTRLADDKVQRDSLRQDFDEKVTVFNAKAYVNGQGMKEEEKPELSHAIPSARQVAFRAKMGDLLQKLNSAKKPWYMGGNTAEYLRAVEALERLSDSSTNLEDPQVVKYAVEDIRAYFGDPNHRGNKFSVRSTAFGRARSDAFVEVLRETMTADEFRGFAQEMNNHRRVEQWVNMDASPERLQEEKAAKNELEGKRLFGEEPKRQQQPANVMM